MYIVCTELRILDNRLNVNGKDSENVCQCFEKLAAIQITSEQGNGKKEKKTYSNTL